MTLVRGDPLTPLALSGGGPAGEASAPLTVGHPFRCRTCGAATFLISPVGFVISLALAVGVLGAIGKAVNPAVGPRFGAGAAILMMAALAARDVWVRLAHPRR